jgi:hypothetical protein
MPSLSNNCTANRETVFLHGPCQDVISRTRQTGNLVRCPPVRELHVAFKIPYMCDYVTKLCRTQAEVILNHVNPNVCGIRQGEARHRKCKRLKLGGSQAYDRSAD